MGDRRWNGFSILASVLGTGVGIVLIATIGFHVTYNTTASLPPGLYRIEPLARAPRPGDVVGVCLEGVIAKLAITRGYVHSEGLEPLVFGEGCPEPIAMIGKPVAAVPGDTIDVGPGGVRVNGRLLGRSVVRRRDSAGRSLPAARFGRVVLQDGEYWLESPYSAESLDSRVFGPVQRHQLRDRRIALLARDVR